MEIALAVAELVAVLVIVLTGCFIGLFALICLRAGAYARGSAMTWTQAINRTFTVPHDSTDEYAAWG